MAKKKIELKNLGKDHIKKHLVIVHPFLRRKFRTIKATELNSKKVFKEFFGEEVFQSFKLRAIYEYQL